MESQVVCRVCRSISNCGEGYTWLYGDVSNKLGLPDMITKYTPIQLDAHDHVSKLICNKCKNYIIDWHKFWENCLKGENELERDTFLNISDNEEEIVKNPDSLSSEISETSNEQLAVVETDSCNSTNISKGRLGAVKIYGSFYCIAKWCNNNNRTCKMFRIPIDERCHTWLKRAGRDDLINLEPNRLHIKYLCDKHFTDNMFKNSNKNSLVWNALPSLFLTRKTYKCSTSHKKEINGPKSLNSTDNEKHCQSKMIKLEASTANQQCTFSSVNSTSGSSTEILQVPFQLHSSNLKQVLVVSAEQFAQCNYRKTLQSCKVLKKLSPKVPRSLLKNRFINKHSEKYVQKKTLNLNSVKIENCDVQNVDTPNSDNTFVNPKSPDQECVPYNNLVASNCLKLVPKENLVKPCGVISVDNTMDHLKESDVDSLCSGQGFREYMNPCLACGEVFLVKSSLDQHCKTYHDANFYSTG